MEILQNKTLFFTFFCLASKIQLTYMRQGRKRRKKDKMSGVKPALEDYRPVSIEEGGKRNYSYFNHVLSLLENRKIN